MLHVACDVCRRRYQVDESRLETELICKECSVPFDVCRENFVDPDEPEQDTDDPEQDQPVSEWKEVWACVVNGVGAMGVIVALAAMLMLLFRDPHEAPGPAAAAASTVARSNLSAPPTSPPAARLRDRVGGIANDAPSAGNPGEMAGGVSETARNAEHLVAADHSAVATEEFDGPPLRRQVAREEPAQRPSIRASESNTGIDYNGPDAIPSSGRRINGSTALEVGQIVQVEYNRRWYAADVLRVNANSAVRIHYRGWSDSWDEDVPRSRIQLAHEE